LHDHVGQALASAKTDVRKVTANERTEQQMKPPIHKHNSEQAQTDPRATKKPAKVAARARTTQTQATEGSKKKEAQVQVSHSAELRGRGDAPTDASGRGAQRDQRRDFAKFRPTDRQKKAFDFISRK
jgi:hypothetical protein